MKCLFRYSNVVSNLARCAVQRAFGNRGTALAAVFVLLPALVTPNGRGSFQAPAVTLDYDHDVHVILADHCLSCHSQEKRSGGLSLAAYDDIINGGRSGAAVKPGRSADSLIMQRITGKIEPRMPFGKDPLNEKEIATIQQWIDQGARSAPGAAPAKAKWEAPLALTAPPIPDSPWKEWQEPIDRYTASYLAKQGVAEPAIVGDAEFARRAYLDIWGLLPNPDQLRAFASDKTPDKRKRLAATLLADDTKYSENWISFWNDLLRNDEGVVYYSETAARKSITPWLLNALQKNTPYNQWVTELLNPTKEADPDGFLIGVNWRGTVSASQTPALQAAQNTAQIFLGINLKCNSCHDSFISRWKLKDAYALASYFTPEDKLQLYRCDVAQNNFATAAYLYPALNRTPPTNTVTDRRATAAAIFTDPRNGRMPRTLVNRVWQKLMGRGFVEDVDDMDGEPWSPELLDWLASDFAANGYDIKRLVATVVSSRTYQLPAVPRKAAPGKEYAFRGPEARRLTAEEFADAVAAITGDWHVLPPPAAKGADIPTGSYSREWRIAGGSLTRALGRPIRDQVFSTRDTQATTIQALELVNGESLTHWLWRGSRKMLGDLPAEPTSLVSRQVNSGARDGAAIPFDVDVSKMSKLYLIVQDALSTAPDKATPLWRQASFVGPKGETPLSALKPMDNAGLREGGEPLPEAMRVKFPSVLVYDIAGKGFTRFRGAPGLEEVPLVQGENVQARFFVFDQKPSMDRLVPPNPATPLPELPTLKTASAAVDRVYWYALGRAPSAAERRIAETALHDPSNRGNQPGKPSPDGLADLLWAVLMTPEFQIIR
jgi:mono/diheme cytochrome c family protein